MMRTYRSATRRPLPRRASTVRVEMLETRESPTDLFGLLSGLFLFWDPLESQPPRRVRTRK
jgi:hypothetical protein